MVNQMATSQASCIECGGNGWIRVPYSQTREEIHAMCPTCAYTGTVDPKTEEHYKNIIREKEERIEELLRDNKKLANEYNDQVDRLRKAGVI